MNLYLVLALALGAISGVIEAPLAKPALSTRAAERGDSSRQELRRSARVAVTRERFARPRRSVRACLPALLTCNVSPRAPAI
jgi:hypothetical protein